MHKGNHIKYINWFIFGDMVLMIIKYKGGFKPPHLCSTDVPSNSWSRRYKSEHHVVTLDYFFFTPKMNQES